MNIYQQIRGILAAADCHQIQAVYGGAGARKTPISMLRLMTRIATFLDARGWTLWSGGAEGADEAFDHQVTRAGIFLPWPDFAETNRRVNSLPIGPGITIYERPTTNAARAWCICAAALGCFHRQHRYRVPDWWQSTTEAIHHAQSSSICASAA